MRTDRGQCDTIRSIGLRDSIQYYNESNEAHRLLSYICVPINRSEILTDFHLKEEDWTSLLNELKNASESNRENIMEDINKKYGNDERSALMSILVCHPPLEVVTILVELMGRDSVTQVSKCGFNAIHYACWGNASVDVIQHLLEIGGKKSLRQKSVAAKANPLHVACIRYTSTESNHLCDVIRLLIKVGKHDVVSATDLNGEIPIHGLLLRLDMPVTSVITFFDEWYELEKTGGTILPNEGPQLSQRKQREAFDFDEEAPYSQNNDDSNSDESTGDSDNTHSDEFIGNVLDSENVMKRKKELNQVLNKRTILPNEGPQLSQRKQREAFDFDEEAPHLQNNDDSNTDESTGDSDNTHSDELIGNGLDSENVMKRKKELNQAVNKMTQKLLQIECDARSQILKTDFMKKYLTEKFIEPLPLAILMIDLYVQVVLVGVLSFFIDNNSSNPVDTSTIKVILSICVSWRIFRELIQLTTSSLGTYASDIFNWFDIAQIVLIISTVSMTLDDHFSNSVRVMLVLSTFCAWLELLFEVHHFYYELAVFVVATTKIMKRLSNFIFTLFILIAMFANVYYISSTHDKEFCDKAANITQADFISTGGFTCTRLESYRYSLTNLFAFEIPSGVYWLIPLLYSSVMSVIFLNIVIAVIVTAFEDVTNESEMSFWSDRLIIVNELECILSSSSRSILTSCSGLIHLKSLRCVIYFLGVKEQVATERIDLSIFLPNSAWDRIHRDDKTFIHWWYGKNTDCPSLRERLLFFMRRSRWKDIMIPSNVFENILLGYKRAYRSSKCQKLSVLPFSIMLMVVSNILYAVLFILGCVSFGFLWPKMMKRRLFSVNLEKKRITPEVQKKNKVIDEMSKENTAMRKENSEMREEIRDMRNMTKKILSAVDLSKEIHTD